MSHEIRTPLNAIVGFGELLRGGDLGEIDRKVFTDAICRNGHALTQLISDILDLSKVESGHLTLERVSMSLPNLLADLTLSMTIAARDRNIELSVRSASDIPEMITSDLVRLRQILLNLVGNALKFTQRGKVEIIVRLATNAPSGGQRLEFVVVDTGCGISDEAQSRLFRPFVQADSSTTRRYGGTGLGLALSRRLAQALGGDLVLEWSEEGKGSAFKFWINAAPMSHGIIRNISLRPTWSVAACARAFASDHS